MKPPGRTATPLTALFLTLIALIASPDASAQDRLNRPTIGRTQARPTFTIVLAKLEIERLGGDLEEWGTSQVINSLGAEKFRWSTSQSASLGALQWYVANQAPTAGQVPAPATILQRGSPGAQLPAGQKRSFEVYFPPFGPASPPNVPIKYWVFLAPAVGPQGQPGVPVSTSVVVEYRKPSAPVVLDDIPAFEIADDRLGMCASTPDTYYRLPFDDDGDWKLFKGNWDDAGNAHNKNDMNGMQAFAFDFVHDYNNDGQGEAGQNVRAARGGMVFAVMDSMSGNMWGGGTPPGYTGVGNFVVIKHADATYGVYWHHQKGSASVQVGQIVQRGQVISQIGNTGNSTTPHLHFDVRSGWDPDFPYEDNEFPSVPVRFQDQNHPNCWLPRTGQAMASNNS